MSIRKYSRQPGSVGTLSAQRSTKKGRPRAAFLIRGRGGEIRTRDPHNPIVVRYQAALRPDRDAEPYSGTAPQGGHDNCRKVIRKGGILSGAVF